MRKFHVDLATFSSSKMFGPQGCALLFKRRGVQIEPIIHGGDGVSLWLGTKNMSVIMGFTEALKQLQENRKSMIEKVNISKTFFIESLKRVHIDFPSLFIHSKDNYEKFSPHIISVGYLYTSGERMVILIDSYGVEVSSKSACQNNNDGVSHVIKAMFQNDTTKKLNNYGVIRFSIGTNTSRSDIEKGIEALRNTLTLIEKEREMLR